MPDLTDQLRGYHDALAATVEPVTAAEAMTTAAPPSPEVRDRRARWHWRIVAAAAAVLVVVAGSVAVLGSRGPMRWLTDDGGDLLRDRTFVAVSMHDRGGEPEPATGSLTFSDDSIDVYDGCNSGNGPYAIEQGRLLAGSVVMTGAACGHPDSQSGRWTRVLASAAFDLDDDRLILSDDSISVELVDQTSQPSPGTIPDEASTTTVASDAHPPTLAELEGRLFRSTSVREAGEESELAPRSDGLGGSDPSTLTFQVRSDVLSASGGCNGMTSTPTIADGLLKVTGGAQTEISCAEALENQDAWYFAVLESSPEISLAGTTLTITTGATVLVFAEAPSIGPTPTTTTSSPTTTTTAATAPTTIDPTTS